MNNFKVQFYYMDVYILMDCYILKAPLVFWVTRSMSGICYSWREGSGNGFNSEAHQIEGFMHRGLVGDILREPKSERCSGTTSSSRYSSSWILPWSPVMFIYPTTMKSKASLYYLSIKIAENQIDDNICYFQWTR